MESNWMETELLHWGPQVTSRGGVNSILDFIMLVLKWTPKTPTLEPQGCLFSRAVSSNVVLGCHLRKVGVWSEALLPTPKSWPFSDLPSASSDFQACKLCRGLIPSIYDSTSAPAPKGHAQVCFSPGILCVSSQSSQTQTLRTTHHSVHWVLTSSPF